MPDVRKHRGPHPRDAQLFGPDQVADLRRAAAHLSWLLSRGYAVPSALKLVGDRFGLTQRQRLAVARSSCSDRAAEERASRRAELDQVTGEKLRVDGFNLLTTIEAALAGGVLLLGRDGVLRDMASMHGSYRRVAETEPALSAIGSTLEPAAPASVLWYLDKPVSNSGRLARSMRDLAVQRGWPWTVEVVPDPDPILSGCGDMVVSADAAILDQCDRWLHLAAEVVQRQVPGAWVVSFLADR